MVEGGLKRMDDFGSFYGFQGKNYGRTLGVFYQEPTFGLGGLRMWYKYQKISGEKRNMSSI